MRLDGEFRNHIYRHVELQNEVNMTRLADAARSAQTATSFYKVYSEKLLRLMSQFKTKGAVKSEMSVPHNPLLRQEEIG